MSSYKCEYIYVHVYIYICIYIYTFFLENTFPLKKQSKRCDRKTPYISVYVYLNLKWMRAN